MRSSFLNLVPKYVYTYWNFGSKTRGGYPEPKACRRRFAELLLTATNCHWRLGPLSKEKDNPTSNKGEKNSLSYYKAVLVQIPG